MYLNLGDLSGSLYLKLLKVEHAEVMEEMDLGPNGGLIFCMELLLENKGNVINKKGLSCRTSPAFARVLAKSLWSVFL